MKNRKLLAVIIAMIAVLCLTFTACGGPANLEEFYADNDLSEEFGEEEGLEISIKGNEVIYTYDIQALGMATDQLSQDQLKEALDKALDTSKKTFVNLAKQLEEETGFTGISITATYLNGGTEITSQTFTSGD